MHDARRQALRPRGQGLDLELGAAGGQQEGHRVSVRACVPRPCWEGTNRTRRQHALEAVAGQATPIGRPLQLREHGDLAGAASSRALGGPASRSSSSRPFAGPRAGSRSFPRHHGRRPWLRGLRARQDCRRALARLCGSPTEQLPCWAFCSRLARAHAGPDGAHGPGHEEDHQPGNV